MDFIDIIKKLIERKKLGIKIISSFAVLAVLFVLLRESEYRTTIKLLPSATAASNSSNLLSKLGPLAGLAGISVADVSEFGVTSYPEIVYSNNFLRKVIDTPINLSSEDSLKSYKDLLLAKQSTFGHSLAKYTIRLPWTLKELILSKPEPSYELEDNIVAYMEEEIAAIADLRERIFIIYDEFTGLVTISVVLDDPVAAASVAKVVYNELAKYVYNYRTSKTKEQIKYLDELYGLKLQEYQLAQDEFAEFLDQNRDITQATFEFEKRNLQRALDLKSSLFYSISENLETAKMKLIEESEVMTLLEPIYIPIEKSNLSSVIVLVIFLVAGGAMYVMIIIAPVYYMSIRKIIE